MNLLGPELVRDLISLIQRAEADDTVTVLVFRSADPDYFISHVDLTRIGEYRAEAAKLTGEASIALLFRYLSTSPLVSIAQIEGRVRAARSEFVLACDMRFAARESAIFGQFEPSLGVIPGGGAVQHLTRLMGRARALEVMLSADDYDADLAERYGWINRALPADVLGGFVTSLARRIAGFPAAGQAELKDRVNAKPWTIRGSTVLARGSRPQVIMLRLAHIRAATHGSLVPKQLDGDAMVVPSSPTLDDSSVTLRTQRQGPTRRRFRVLRRAASEAADQTASRYSCMIRASLPETHRAPATQEGPHWRAFRREGRGAKGARALIEQ